MRVVRLLGSREFVRELSSSKFNYWAGYVANFSLVFWLFSFAWMDLRSGTLPGSSAAVAFFAGVLIWTFLEYVLHRFLYHEIKSPLSVGHDLHHHEPKELLGVPWYLTTIVVIALQLGLVRVFAPAKTGIVFGAAWLGYIGYCLVHHLIHHANFPNRYFQKLRRNHLVHHARDDVNWGITTTLWDHVFRTYRKTGL